MLDRSGLPPKLCRRSTAPLTTWEPSVTTSPSRCACSELPLTGVVERRTAEIHSGTGGLIARFFIGLTRGHHNYSTELMLEVVSCHFDQIATTGTSSFRAPGRRVPGRSAARLISVWGREPGSCPARPRFVGRRAIAPVGQLWSRVQVRSKPPGSSLRTSAPVSRPTEARNRS